VGEGKKHSEEKESLQKLRSMKVEMKTKSMEGLKGDIEEMPQKAEGKAKEKMERN
jgi:hypothetical protein